MGLLKLLGLSTQHEGNHAAQGQRGKHARKPAKPPKNPKKGGKK
jgi:hypothetical protein